jgi:hypothetical protein
VTHEPAIESAPTQISEAPTIVAGATGKAEAQVADFSGGAASIVVPVFDPVAMQRGRTRRNRAVAIVIALVLAGTGVVAWKALTGSAALSAVDASLSVTPASGIGHCPNAKFLFTAVVHTNGSAGQLSFQWKVNGQPQTAQTARVAAQTDALTTTLSMPFKGPTSGSGTAQFLVVGPDKLSTNAIEVIYACP